MKFSYLLLFFCLISAFQNSSDNLIFKRSLEVDPPRPESLKKFPITITINKQELTICILESVGSVQIKIMNESDQLVRQLVINSMIQRTEVVSMPTWRVGKYTIHINYNTTTLLGEFVL